jgi:hypothetical protein
MRLLLTTFSAVIPHLQTLETAQGKPAFWTHALELRDAPSGGVELSLGNQSFVVNQSDREELARLVDEERVSLGPNNWNKRGASGRFEKGAVGVLVASAFCYVRKGETVKMVYAVDMSVFDPPYAAAEEFNCGVLLEAEEAERLVRALLGVA